GARDRHRPGRERIVPRPLRSFALRVRVYPGGHMQPILHSFAYSLGYLREQIADVSDGQLTAQPDGVPNHAAWTIGHLVFIAQEIGGVIGIEPWLGDEWTR